MPRENSARSPHTSLPRELKCFLVLSALLSGLSLLYAELKLHFAHGPTHGLPAAIMAPPFGDLYAFSKRLQFVHEPLFFKPEWGWNYSAPCIFLYKFLYLFCLGRYGHQLYLLFFFLCLSFFLVKMAAALETRGLSSQNAWLLLICSTLMSWPIFFGLHQGNTDTLIWMGAAVGIWAYYREKWLLSAIVIGIVAAFKIYPILLLGLFFPLRKYRQAIAGLLMFGAVTLASLAYVGPSISAAYRKISGGIKLLSEVGFNPGGVDRDYLTLEHSIVSLIRVLTVHHPHAMRVIFAYYMPVAGALTAAFFLIFIWKMPRANQVLVVVLAAVLLPPKSYDYTLEMLYIPWAWLALIAVSAAVKGRTVKGLTAMMACFAIVCSPELFIKFQGFYSYGQFKTVVMLVMLGMAARYPYEEIPPSLAA